MPEHDVLTELIERIQNNIDAYKSAGYNEAQLRGEFINPLFEALAKLKPVFKKDGSVTAGNSSQRSHSGAISIGHPLGCTGAKLTVQIRYELRRRKKKYGMVTACVGGGQGISGIIELLNSRH